MNGRAAGLIPTARNSWPHLRAGRRYRRWPIGHGLARDDDGAVADFEREDLRRGAGLVGEEVEEADRIAVVAVPGHVNVRGTGRFATGLHARLRPHAETPEPEVAHLHRHQ